MIPLDNTWASHREIRLLLVPVSPMRSDLFERCCKAVVAVSSGSIELKSLLPPPPERTNVNNSGSVFEHFSWSSGNVSFGIISGSSKHEYDSSHWAEYEPYRRIRAVIGLQLCDTHVGNFKAQEIAITFATKECNADTVHLASAGLYVDANCLPFVLYQGNLQPTTFDAVVKAVILDACLALHADAAALAAEHIESKHEARFSGDHTSHKPSKVAGTKLFFASSLDRHQLGPKVSPKLADARKMKRLADLALLAGSPLDAAKHAALASTELRALDDAQWYAGALCTWCAAVLGCIEVGNEDGLLLFSAYIPRVSGIQHVSEPIVRHIDSFRGDAERYLQCCVTMCAREALRVFLKDTKLIPLASEVALKMCRWLEHSQSHSSKMWLLEFVDALISMSSDKVYALGSVEATRIATAASLICRRACYVRKAVTLVAIAATSCSVGCYQGTAALWYLNCSLTSAWGDHSTVPLPHCKQDQKLRAWSIIRLATLHRLASNSRVFGIAWNGYSESALRAWVSSLYLESEMKVAYYAHHAACTGRLVTLTKPICSSSVSKLMATQRGAPGHPVCYSRDGGRWQQSCILESVRFRVPYFARISNHLMDSCGNNNTSLIRYSQKPSFNPFAQKREEMIRNVSNNSQAFWIKGERHSIALVARGHFQAKMSLTSARLELLGTESVAHDHFFHDLSPLSPQKLMFQSQILLDATALQRDDIRIRGIWMTWTDDQGHELTSLHDIKANTLGPMLTVANCHEDPAEVHTKSRVASVQPRVLVKVVPEKANPLDRTDYATVGIRSGEQLALKLHLKNVSETSIDQLELWIEPLRGYHKSTLIFHHASSMCRPVNDLHAFDRDSCAILDETEAENLRRQLTLGSKSLDVLLRLGHSASLRMGVRIICVFAAFDGMKYEVQREVGVTMVLVPRPGLACTRIDRNTGAFLLHVRNEADIPFRLAHGDSDVWITVRAGNLNSRLRLLTRDAAADPDSQVQWQTDGAVRPELDGTGLLSMTHQNVVAES